MCIIIFLYGHKRKYTPIPHMNNTFLDIFSCLVPTFKRLYINFLKNQAQNTILDSFWRQKYHRYRSDSIEIPQKDMIHSTNCDKNLNIVSLIVFDWMQGFLKFVKPFYLAQNAPKRKKQLLSIHKCSDTIEKFFRYFQKNARPKSCSICRQ